MLVLTPQVRLRMQQLKQQSASAMPDAGAVAVAVPLATVTRSILASEAVPVGALWWSDD